MPAARSKRTADGSAALLSTFAVPAAAPAKKRSCKAKREQAGCVPVIGQTYHRHFDINADNSPLVKNQVALDLTVKITGASMGSMTFTEKI